MAGVFDLDALPQELLERVLAWLPIADLVVLRAVCRRWRAAIAHLAAADAPFAFECGWPDLLQNAPWLQQERALLITTPRARGGMRTAEEIDGELAKRLREFLEHAAREYPLPCTCGAPQIIKDDSAPKPHGSRLRPARYALLAPERALAFKVSAAALALFRHCNVLDVSHFGHGGGCMNEWLPVWFYLPTNVQRPASAMEFDYLARRLMDEYLEPGEQPLLVKLDDPAFARTFYQDARKYLFPTYRHAPDADNATALDWEDPESWKDTTYPANVKRGPDVGANDDGDKLYDSHAGDFDEAIHKIQQECALFADASRGTRDRDMTRFDTLRLEARQSAAAWRIVCALNWTPWLKRVSRRVGFYLIQWHLHRYGVDPDDAAAVQAYLDRQVAVTDQAVAAIKGILRHALISGSSGFSGGGPLWVLGLSPAGHVVGAVTYLQHTD